MAAMAFISDQPDPVLQPWLSRSRWVVGLSGGLDSIALLSILREYLQGKDNAPELVAIHINHQLSPNASAWAQHCRAVCEEVGIPLTVRLVEVVPTGSGSLEDAARNARYRAFEELLQADDVLMLAHHQDDQVETLMLRLLRGAGLQGLGAMRPLRDIGKASLLRPLLSVPRSELEAYARQKNLAWVDDESNSDQSLDRNYLRHAVLPALEERWPAYREAFARAVAHSQEASGLIEELARQDREGRTNTDQYGYRLLSLAGFESLDHSRLKNLLRGWFASNEFPAPSSKQLEAIISEVIQAREDSTPLVETPRWQVRRYRDQLYLMNPLPPHDSEQVIQLEGAGEVDLGGAGKLVAREVKGEGLSPCGDMTIRFRDGGETLQLAGRKTKTLKQLLQEQGVPPWLRSRVPLIYCGQKLVAVAGLGVVESCTIDKNEMGMVVQWRVNQA
jgi:tRNA(Ile)-lysidine synthase